MRDKKLRYLGRRVTNQDLINVEIETNLYSGIACYD
jgi:hypothetical protein